MSSMRSTGFQYVMDFTITEINTNEQRAENDSCLTFVSMSTERFCWDKVKFTAQCAALFFIKSQPRSLSTPLSLPAVSLNK